VLGDLGSVDLRCPEHLGGAVAVLHDRPHLDPRRRMVRIGRRNVLPVKSHDRFPFKGWSVVVLSVGAAGRAFPSLPPELSREIPPARRVLTFRRLFTKFGTM